MLYGSSTLTRRLPEWTARYRDGRTVTFPAADRMYAVVLCRGVWEPIESRAMHSVLRPGDFAIDVGANRGWHSIAMAKAVGHEGTVWAFEPLPAVADALTDNLTLNPELNVTVFPVALGASAGVTTMHVFRGLSDGHASALRLGRDDYDPLDVSQHALDDLMSEAPGQPALVKVDAEGSELAVLQGARNLAGSADAPIWLFEINWETSRAFGYEPPELLQFLAGLNDYRTYRLGPRGASAERDPERAPHAGAWLVVPEGRRDRVANLVINYPGAGGS